MAIQYPIATSAAQAVSDPLGFASKTHDAQPVAADHFTGLLPHATPDEDRARYAREVRCTHVSAFAPGRWKSREAVVERWTEAIDAFWGEALALTDGTWRLGIRYFQVKAPLVSQLTDEERDQIADRAARPMQPKRPKPQEALDFGLFAQLVGISPDALEPGSFEVPDPLRPGRTLPDE